MGDGGRLGPAVKRNKNERRAKALFNFISPLAFRVHGHRQFAISARTATCTATGRSGLVVVLPHLRALDIDLTIPRT